MTCAYVFGAGHCSESLCPSLWGTRLAFEVDCVNKGTVIAGLFVPASCLVGCRPTVK